MGVGWHAGRVAGEHPVPTCIMSEHSHVADATLHSCAQGPGAHEVQRTGLDWDGRARGGAVGNRGPFLSGEEGGGGEGSPLVVHRQANGDCPRLTPGSDCCSLLPRGTISSTHKEMKGATGSNRWSLECLLLHRSLWFSYVAPAPSPNRAPCPRTSVSPLSSRRLRWTLPSTSTATLAGCRRVLVCACCAGRQGTSRVRADRPDHVRWRLQVLHGHWNELGLCALQRHLHDRCCKRYTNLWRHQHESVFLCSEYRPRHSLLVQQRRGFASQRHVYEREMQLRRHSVMGARCRLW
jgi:hypothetical protein